MLVIEQDARHRTPHSGLPNILRPPSHNVSSRYMRQMHCQPGHLEDGLSTLGVLLRELGFPGWLGCSEGSEQWGSRFQPLAATNLADLSPSYHLGEMSMLSLLLLVTSEISATSQR